MTTTTQKTNTFTVPATPGARLQYLLDDDGINGSELGRELTAYDPDNYSLTYRTNISRFLNDKKEIPVSLLKTLEEIRGYNRYWIQHGSGSPRVSKQTAAHLDVPLLTAAVQLGGDRAELGTPLSWTARHRFFGGQASKYKAALVVEVADESMRPGLLPGALLRCVAVERAGWLATGGVVVCCYTDDQSVTQVLVRRVNEVGPQSESIRLLADNWQGVTYTVPVEQIHWLLRVERVIDSPVQ